MTNDKKGDLTKHKDEIKELLKLDIVTRYQFQKGKVIASLKNDPDIAEGIKIINDPPFYQSILAGTYKQPVAETNGNNVEESPDDTIEMN
jgi:carboxyl-terminal processing protease